MIAIALLIPVGILVGLGALVYFLVRGTRAEEGFSSRNLLRAYLRVAFMVSLVVFMIGAVNTLTGAFGGVFGRDFSYQPNGFGSSTICPAPSPATPGGAPVPGKCVTNSTSQFNSDDTRLQDDLIRGISLMVTGLIVGLGHRVGQFAMETPEERRRSGLARAETLVGTLAFGLVSIVALPVASYSVLHRVILGSQAANTGQTDTPGSALALALVFLPAWLYYLYNFVMGARRGPGARPTEVPV